MSAIRNRLGAAVALAGAAAITLGAVGEASAAESRVIRCNIGRVGFSGCNGDQVKVNPGQRVYIDLDSSGQKGVKFQVYNKDGHHKLGAEGPWQDQDQGPYFLWQNDTNKPITIDVEADADGLRNVSAVAHINVR